MIIILDMFKVDKDIAKKSIKQMMVISAFAILLVAAMGSIPSMKSYAQSNGMDFMKMVPGIGSHGSDGSNKGNLGTDSLLGCFGVATDCTNKDNNNRHTHITTTPPVTTTPPPPPVPGDCDACFSMFLNPTQEGNLNFVLGVPVAGTEAQLCTAAQLHTEAELRAAITMPVVGVTDAVATNIINCLISHGIHFATA